MLEKIRSGERIPGIEKDPLESADTDVVVDYSVVPGFLQREKSIVSGEDKLRIQPHAGSIKNVNKMLSKAREVKAHHHHDDEKAHADTIQETHEEHKNEEEVQHEEKKEEEKAEAVVAESTDNTVI